MEDDDKPTKRSRAHICRPLSQGTVPSEGTKRNGEGGGAREKREMTQGLCRSVVMFKTNHTCMMGRGENERVKGEGREREKKPFQVRQRQQNILSYP